MSATRTNGAENKIEAALRPFGWKCGPEFWTRYYTDAWVFHLANALERRSWEVEQLKMKLENAYESRSTQ